MARRVILDVRTQELREEEFEFTPPPPPEPPIAINVVELKKLLDHAKKMGWI